MAFTEEEQKALWEYDMRWRGAGIANADEWAKGLPTHIQQLVTVYFVAVTEGHQKHVISDEQWAQMMEQPKFNAKCRAARAAREAQLSANAFWLFGLLGLVGFAIHPAVGWVLIALAIWMMLGSFAATSRQTDAEQVERL
tara:strand:- start:203 stop:622 length:420 start_codon:yes stop_codon:yes gene_type:complete